MGFIRSASVFGGILLSLQHGIHAQTICSAADSKTLGPDVRDTKTNGECLKENCTSKRIKVKLAKQRISFDADSFYFVFYLVAVPLQ